MTIRISVPDDLLGDRLADLDDVDVVQWDWEGAPPADGPPLDLAVRPYVLSGGLDGLDADRIRNVQTQSLGYDDAIGNVPDGITWCNAVGVHEGATAEMAITLALASSRDLDRYARAQTVPDWEKTWTHGLIDRRVLVVGVGGIGSELLARLDGFGASVTRVASHARDDDQGHVHGTDELPDLLPEADVVFVVVPLGPSTEGLVDDAFLSALPDGALVVNVSRGKVHDAAAVLDHARRGRIRFAADVWDPEPLPADDPLWSTPGVLISPHVGGVVHSMHDRVEKLVRRQVAHLQAGEPLENVVDVSG